MYCFGRIPSGDCKQAAAVFGPPAPTAAGPLLRPQRGAAAGSSHSRRFSPIRLPARCGKVVAL